MSLVDENFELNKTKMNFKDDPKVLFDQIALVEARDNTKTRKIREKEKITVILS